MYNTTYPEVNSLLADLLAEHCRVLGDQLTGLYLFGSLVSGDFDPARSDVDLLAALADDLDAGTMERLRLFHDDLAARYPAWAGRDASRCSTYRWRGYASAKRRRTWARSSAQASRSTRAI